MTAHDLEAHNSCQTARLDYGITDGPVYRDAAEPGSVLVHLDVQEITRAMEWFKSQAFKEGVARAGKVKREIWIADHKMTA